MTGRVAVEQMMAAGEPKVAQYTHPPLTYLTSRHRLSGQRQYILFESSGQWRRLSHEAASNRDRNT
jgi:hypothetical protein